MDGNDENDFEKILKTVIIDLSKGIVRKQSMAVSHMPQSGWLDMFFNSGYVEGWMLNEFKILCARTNPRARAKTDVSNANFSYIADIWESKSVASKNASRNFLIISLLLLTAEFSNSKTLL